MKVNQLIKDFFTKDEIKTMTSKAVLVYENMQDEVDLFLFKTEDGYLEVRANEGSVNINDLSIVNTEDEEMDTSITKERLFELLGTIEEPLDIYQIDVD